ncbi:MAG: aminotransferase [Alphaproteobacteria bacterium]|nr:aminotransferase [Alphaproteobacteria bacterium]
MARSNVAYDTKEIWQKDKDHFIHPWTNFATFNDQGSEVIAAGDGAYIYDSNGTKYLDGIGGLWCVNIGYGRDEMAEAIAEQVRRLPYFSPFGHQTNPPAALLADKLADLAPKHINHVFYSNSGSVANDTAVRIVHFYFNQIGKPKKKLIISRVDAYHGMTYLSAALTGVAFDKIGFDTAESVVRHVSAPYTYRRPAGMTPEQFLDHLVKELDAKVQELGPDNCAAFIAEPIMGAGGVLVAPQGYHRRMKEVCQKYGMLYISDEVVTGFGRLGHFFASEPVFDVTPDIITSAKGISSGYLPLGATLISDQIYDALRTPQAKGALFTIGYTYSGHPVVCAAALKNIEIMEREDIPGHVRKVGPYFEQQLATLLDLPLVGDVRGKGFMMCIENVANKQTKELLPPEADVGGRIARHCQERGLIVRPLGHLNIMSPPLILTKEQIDFFVGTLREAIKLTQDDLVREKLWKG